MKELETSKHLFQRPMYRSPAGLWTYDFTEALQHCGGQVHLDTTTIASILSFGMAGQDRTMLKEVSRRPWLSKVESNGGITLEPVPPHGFFTGTDEQLAERFYQLLCNEARTVCAGFKEIYILLSGGMDSRIIAGVLADLYRAGEIQAKPVAVTWGLSDSRDVVYAERMAKILGFEWKNIEFGPEMVLENIDATARQLGLLHSPELLHNMLWFKNIPSTALVLAGSFGDSIGRAEFGGLHLLQLPVQTPKNRYALLKPNVYQAICKELKADLDAIHSRAKGDVPLYAKNEHWMQGYRMRGGLCHALCVINQYANIYQMYTAPEVFEFMWSLHPSRRDDEIYATLLQNKFPALARVPWPRTNRAIRGPTEGARNDLRPEYHEYIKWSSGPLYAELNSRIDPDWFETFGIFDPESIREMKKLVKASRERVGHLNRSWLWLAGFRTFIEYLEENGKKAVIQTEWPDEVTEAPRKASLFQRCSVCVAGTTPLANSALRAARKYGRKQQLKRLKKEALRKYPPVPVERLM